MIGEVFISQRFTTKKQLSRPNALTSVKDYPWPLKLKRIPSECGRPAIAQRGRIHIRIRIQHIHLHGSRPGLRLYQVRGSWKSVSQLSSEKITDHSKHDKFFSGKFWSFYETC